MTDAELTARVEAVRARIARAATRAGRDPGEIKLLPVSKTRPVAVIEQVARVCGVGNFAENRPQELAAKAAALPGLDWVLIGPLQRNKAGLAAKFATQFQALDSLAVAQALDRRLIDGRRLDVMIEVNTSGEPTKHGVAPDDAPALARGLLACPALHPIGLMTVAVNSTDDAVVRACFRRLRQVQARLGIGEYPELSMGMSSDFETAIEEGATVVRLGTAIFGPRD